MRLRYRYRDFAHFVSVWVLTTQALRRADDFRRVVVEYAREASAYGAAYIEAIYAGELAGVGSIRDSLERLRAHRIRHGIRAVDDPGLVRELADRRTVLDVCPISNLRLGAVRSLEEHPLPDLVAAGVLCSLSTDDPALFGTNLEHEYETARSLGLRPRDFYEAGVEGALCDAETRERLRRTGEAFAWNAEDASSEASAPTGSTWDTAAPARQL